MGDGENMRRKVRKRRIKSAKQKKGVQREREMERQEDRIEEREMNREVVRWTQRERGIEVRCRKIKMRDGGKTWWAGRGRNGEMKRERKKKKKRMTPGWKKDGENLDPQLSLLCFSCNLLSYGWEHILPFKKRRY